MLSLSQLQTWNDVYPGFQQTVTPMEWPDGFRVPAVAYRAFVQHAWPAAILIAAASLYRARRRAYWLSLAVAGAFLVFAGVHSALQVSWSEDFRKLAPLYWLLESYRTELLTLSFAAVAMIAWLVSRKLGTAILAIGLLAITALLWSPAPITPGRLETYWNSEPSRVTFSYSPTIPEFHNTPNLVVTLFVTGCFLACLVLAWRKIRFLEVAGVALLIPLLVDTAPKFGNYWFSFGEFFRNWLWCVLFPAGLGLAALTWSVLRRARQESRSGRLAPLG